MNLVDIAKQYVNSREKGHAMIVPVGSESCYLLSKGVLDLQEQLSNYSMSAGQADQRKSESDAVRVALGFSADADDVAPCDLVDAIATLQVRAEAAERERDEAIMTRLEVSECLSIATRRYELAEVEIARRDAAAGEPVGVAVEWKHPTEERRVDFRWIRYVPAGTKLYTAAPPAVLPWHVDSCSNCGSKRLSWDTTVIKNTGVQDGRLKLNETSGLFYLGCDECSETLLKVSADDVANYLNNAKALGAQQQKPVVLPEPHAHLIWIQAGRGPDDYWDDVEVSRSDGDRCCDGSERYAVYSEFEVKSMLDAANIPYEVKL